ncbi:uncharacterized protein LOC124530475 [Vanessa cardui]|uniref:uncharacterized protein LOC124530475 n=1 Tax=Vanessa cardui TaxID=171605 RepID=UPI001F1459C0|nr:uncharacterized protein LOC124530475 [Vanessa cardui]
MPRKYQPDPIKKQYKKYDKTIICKAVEELALPGAKLKLVAEKYNINISVLYRHSKREMKPQGGQTALTEADEEYLITNINACSEWGYPLDTMDLRFIVKMYLDKLGIKHKRFKNNFPGPDLVEGFLKRHSDKIAKRICQNIKRSRAAVSPDTIREYHSELQKSLDGVPPTHILNYDETNLSDDPGRKKVLMKRGTKYPERVMNHSKASTSLMIAGTAAGKLLPPYVVYKAQNRYDSWVKYGPKGARYNSSSSGWFEGKTFEDWITTIAIPYFDRVPGRKVLIGDNLSSHLSAHLIAKCKEKNIDFVFLPANSTHLTQPLDVAFFRPMKHAWRELLLKWKKKDGRCLGTVPKGCFPRLLKLLMEELSRNAETNLKAGFKKCGINPLNVDEILSRLPQSGQEGQDPEAHREVINESVLTFLKEMRFGSMNIREPTKKRKLNVVAGQSVAEEDLEDISTKNAKTVTLENFEDDEELPDTAETNVPVTPNKKRKHEDIDKETLEKKKKNIEDARALEEIYMPSTSGSGWKGKGNGKGKGKLSQIPEKEDKNTSKKVIVEIIDQFRPKSKGLEHGCEETEANLCKTEDDGTGAREEATHDEGVNLFELSKNNLREDKELELAVNSIKLSENISEEFEKIETNIPFDIESMPVYFFDENAAQEVVIDDLPSKSCKKNKINITKVQIITDKNIKNVKKEIKVTSNLRHVRKKTEEGKNTEIKSDKRSNLRPVTLKENLKIPPPNECKRIQSHDNVKIKTEKQSLLAHSKKNYYNNSEEILKVLSENGN